MEIINDEIIEIEKIKCNETFMDLHTDLGNYIAENIIVHNSFPSKKSISCGFYMPSIKKEEVEISAVIDTSGSIDNEQIQEFITEIISIAKSFNNVKIRLITCDCEVKNDYVVENGNIAKIQELKFNGGGGTSFIAGLDYIKENYNNTKLVVYLTDGEGDKVGAGDYPFNLIWVLSKGNDELIKDSGEIIRI